MFMIKRDRKKTIFFRILTPMLLVLVVQLGIYLTTLSAGGIFNAVQEDTLYNFGEKVKNRSQYIATDMTNRWSNVDSIRTSVAQTIDDYLDVNGHTYSDIKHDAALNEKLVEAVSLDILKLMRNNGTTGAFIVLDGVGVQSDPKSYSGMYLRDHDPSHQNAKNLDVLMERGMSGLSRNMGIPLDSYWSASYSFESEDADNAQFFFKPLKAAKNNRVEQSKQNFDYWSHNFSLSGSPDMEIITYSIPLINKLGYVYGVLGVELSVPFLTKLLPFTELGHGEDGIYILGIKDINDRITPVVKSGPAYAGVVGNASSILPSATDYTGITCIKSPEDVSYFVSEQEIRLYNSNTVFSDETWVLMGIRSENDMFAFLSLFRRQIVGATLISLLIGCIVVFIVSKQTTKPVTNLVAELKGSNPNKHITLHKTNVTEVDALSEAIEDLSLLVAQSASRISKIIDLSGFPVGVFEYSTDDDSIFCSDTLLRIMDSENIAREDEYLAKDVFISMMSTLKNYVFDSTSKIYKISDDRWLQLKIYTEGNKTVGAMVDITRDMQEKQQIEYERDYDVLTDLFNRRAFRAKMNRLFSEEILPQLKVSAMVMMDLDNLKYTNDQFGHDIGDKYIQALGQTLKHLIDKNIVVARRSGDEFYVFLHGYNNKHEILDILKKFWDELGEKNITLPNGKLLKVRVSGGIAWYPDDSCDLDELLRLSDFAMYTAKNSLKGSLQQFSSESYRNDAVLYSGQEALNQLIEQVQVKYAMQPIVAVADGSIYGYEMLMRPQSEHLTNVAEVLRVAKANSKNSQIEELTWSVALETFNEKVVANEVSADCKVFINSISNHLLPKKIIHGFEEKYPHILPRIVLEITEDEKSNQEYTKEKLAVVKEWGALLAIDDFGSGYNGENMLLTTLTDIIKIDMGLVRDIDKDTNRQVLVKNIISYATASSIKILAEGVETAEELSVLVKMGVHYIQGYYFAKPSFEVADIPRELIDAMLNIE